eukprot:scaffold1960_cov41-Attheya_sp.AAC.1
MRAGSDTLASAIVHHLRPPLLPPTIPSGALPGSPMPRRSRSRRHFRRHSPRLILYCAANIVSLRSAAAEEEQSDRSM